MDSDAAARRRKRRRVADENRKRATRACELCKARKSKCIESTPGCCQRCSKHNLPCRFPKERSPSLQTEDSGPSRLQDTSAAPSSGKPPEEVVSLEGTVSIDTMRTETILWPQFLAKLRQAFAVDRRTPSRDVHDMVAMQAQITRPASLQPMELARVRAALDVFPPRAVADFLLAVCFRHSVDNFFYFDQAQLLDDMHEFYTDTASPLRSDASFVCLALAVLALASQWTELERPPEDEDADDVVLADHADPGRPFYDHARSLVPDILERHSLRSIEALFVLAVFACPSRSARSCFIDLGLALRVATAADFHIEIEGNMAGDDREREVRRRLWWSLYAVERCTTVKLNRPRTVDAAICKVPAPKPMPELDKRQPFDNIQLQIAYMQLILILDKVADPREWLLDVSQPTRTTDDENRLRQWKSALPDEFKQLENVHPRDAKYRAVFHLYLNYYFAWIVLGKVSLVSLTQATVRYHLRHEEDGGQSPQSPQSPQTLRPAMRVDPSVDALARSCAKAATKMLRLFEHLARTRNLVRFSFTDFQGCCIATTVTLVAGMLERDAGYDARVAFGLGCLRFMAHSNPTASIAMRFVQAFQSISDDAYRQLQKSPSYRHAFQARPGPAPNGGTPGSAADGGSAAEMYRAWAHWLSEQGSTPRSPRQTQPQLQQYRQHYLRQPTAASWPAPSLAVGDSPDDLLGWAPADTQQQLPPFPQQYALPILSGGAPNLDDIGTATDANFFSTPLDEEQVCLLGLTSMDLLGGFSSAELEASPL